MSIITVIRDSNRTYQYDTEKTAFVDDDISNVILINEFGTVLVNKGNPITWPTAATNGLQAIVDVKVGTLRFAYDGWPRAHCEYVVSTYGDSGTVPTPVHPGTKHDQGKPILGAVPPHAELAVGRVLTFGAEKYARGNWDKVKDHENRYMDAALRHLNAHRRGELTDSESGESHLAHAACCILFMLDKQERS